MKRKLKQKLSNIELKSLDFYSFKIQGKKNTTPIKKKQ